MRAAWVGAALLWVAASVGAALARNADEAAGYAAGAVIGRLLGSLVLALALSWIANAVRGGGHRVWHPWTLVLAAAISLVTLAVWRDDDDPIACRDAPRLESAALLADPPEGYRVSAIPDAEARELLDEFPDETRDEISTVNGVVAAKGASGVAVYAITSAGREIDAEAELRAFEDGAREPTRRIEVAGEEGLLVEVEEGTLAMTAIGECGLVLLVSPDEAPVREIAPVLTPPD